MLALSTSSRQLPEPEITLGFSNYPIETGHVWQEPMSQIRIGLKQTLPSQKGRQAKSQSHQATSAEKRYMAIELKARILKNVRSLWLDLFFETEAERLTIASLTKLKDLYEVSRSRYAIGLLDQVDLLELDLEINRLADEIAKHQENQQTKRAWLTQWIHEAAHRPLPDQIPTRSSSGDLESAQQSLLSHPSVLAADAVIETEEAKVRLAESKFRPDLSLNANYALRDGHLPNSDSRSDLLSVSVGFQAPINQKNRQNEDLRSAKLKVSAAKANRLDLLNRLHAHAASTLASYSSLQDRIQEYRLTIVPKALETESAAVSSYQSEIGDYRDVILSQRVALDHQLALTRLQIERLQTWADLQYLTNRSNVD